MQTLAFSANGQLLAAGVGRWDIGSKRGEALLIDVANTQVYKVPSSSEDHVITCVALSPDGKYLATAGMQGILKLWEFNAAENHKSDGSH